MIIKMLVKAIKILREPFLFIITFIKVGERKTLLNQVKKTYLIFIEILLFGGLYLIKIHKDIVNR